MTPEATRRIGHALQAISSIQRYTANASLQESLSDDLTRSAVKRQLGIVQEALRVALVEEPFLRQIWPDVDALLAGCARMRDWEHEVALADLVGFVGGDLMLWQGRLAEGLRLQQDEGAKLDQQISENPRGGWVMSSEWGRVKVKDACELIVDCVNKTAPIVDHKTPYRMIRTSHIKNGRICLTDEKFVSRETYEKWIRRAKLEVGDVLLTREAPLGSVAIIREQDTLFLGQRIVQYRANREVLDPGFLLYSFLAPDLQSQFHSYGGTGSTVDHIRVPDCVRFEISLPALGEQKAIAHILGTLDDKIELNRKTNETLEAMAKALFKSWFVDFDPVRAKAEGRPTGLPAEISDLFPDSFEDSELGEIPTGWRVGTIASSVGVVFDGPHATPKEADEGNVFLGIKNMTGISLDLSDVKLIGHDDWSQWTRRVEPRADDIVFTYEAALGLFAVIPHGLKCCLGRRMALIRTKASNGAPHFWFHQFIAKPFQKVIVERSIHGATVNRTPLTEFPGYPILEPPETLRLAFDHAASSLWARIHAASNQTASLTSLRDALLPKLISGELRIPDAEKLLAEVGI